MMMIITNEQNKIHVDKYFSFLKVNLLKHECFYIVKIIIKIKKCTFAIHFEVEIKNGEIK